MPIDYRKNPKNWKTEIRPAIMKRAGNRCEFCKVENYKYIIRGEVDGIDCYQDDDGKIYDANTSEQIGEDYLGEVHPTNPMIRVVLTVAHLDHDISNNDHANLRALCQRCHNRHDAQHRKQSRKRNKRQLSLFE